MRTAINPSISVDIVVFGFDGTRLKVLLVERQKLNSSATKEYKLPGSMIAENEDLDTSAHHTLQNLTGLNNIYLEQLHVFSDPNRISNEDDKKWIEFTYGITATRIVTVSYFSLVKINLSVLKATMQGKASWCDVQELKHVSFDHKEIILKGLDRLKSRMQSTPIAFELLPKKFTIKQLQNLYEAILGVDIDNRNFRKKILKYPFLIQLDEKEAKVNHKPALLYQFDAHSYRQEQKKLKKLKIF
ncbi:NUDIX hydrolase [uncultured Acetobacteroides sp.]|uniref:NUDIX hydrolase n=1 Tax=uncultured Acetobacteroides sp. TaxID=1760811 RepID=UPI0029F4BBBA|nr:NUDIX hydrolase [uncultured Acetobacteroides sp.]